MARDLPKSDTGGADGVAGAACFASTAAAGGFDSSTAAPHLVQNFWSAASWAPHPVQNALIAVLPRPE